MQARRIAAAEAGEQSLKAAEIVNLAAAFGVPVSALLPAAAEEAAEDETATGLQRLADAYASVDDSKIRRHMIELVESIAAAYGR